jgi:hypothetical protein
MGVMVSMKWQVSAGMGGNFEPERYIAFRSCPATRSGKGCSNGSFRPEYLAT